MTGLALTCIAKSWFFAPNVILLGQATGFFTPFVDLLFAEKKGSGLSIISLEVLELDLQYDWRNLVLSHLLETIGPAPPKKKKRVCLMIIHDDRQRPKFRSSYSHQIL